MLKLKSCSYSGNFFYKHTEKPQGPRVKHINSKQSLEKECVIAVVLQRMGARWLERMSVLLCLDGWVQRSDFHLTAAGA